MPNKLGVRIVMEVSESFDKACVVRAPHRLHERYAFLAHSDTWPDVLVCDFKVNILETFMKGRWTIPLMRILSPIEDLKEHLCWRHGSYRHNFLSEKNSFYKIINCLVRINKI